MGNWTPTEPSSQRQSSLRRERRARSHPGGPECRGPCSAADARACQTLPAVLRVVPWSADLSTVGRVTFPASHRYVEILWTPLVGPTPIILLRRLSEVAQTGGGAVQAADLAAAIGSPDADGSIGRGSPLGRAIARLGRFRMAAWQPRCTLGVATRVRALSDRDLERLPVTFRELHRRFLAEAAPPA